jgi:DNA-binding PadR family transcriptional regulator
MDKNKIIKNFVQELNKGAMVMVVLKLLKKDKYGYALVNRMKEEGIEIEQSTLYPMLRRLEKQDLLTSSWEVSTSRPRKYYKTTDFGESVLEELIDLYNDSFKRFNRIIKEEDNG